jgi:apolipoprotein N-acyltransferase
MDVPYDRALVGSKSTRTALLVVIAHLRSAERTWRGQDVDPVMVLKLVQYNITAMLDWDDETFARVLADATPPPPTKETT